MPEDNVNNNNKVEEEEKEEHNINKDNVNNNNKGEEEEKEEHNINKEEEDSKEVEEDNDDDAGNSHINSVLSSYTCMAHGIMYHHVIHHSMRQARVSCLMEGFQRVFCLSSGILCPKLIFFFANMTDMLV